MDRIVKAHEFDSQSPVAIPAYLQQTYWWAYVHPFAVKLFERQWLVNLILWGNFKRLRDAAVDELTVGGPARTLQIACVYGDFSLRLSDRLPVGSSYSVVDVLPVQLDNLRRKLPDMNATRLFLRDSVALGFADASYDQVILFFLLHEQPAAVRMQTLREALRVTRPGGKVVVMDYHRPGIWHPLHLLMRCVLNLLEPYALDLWRRDLRTWLPTGIPLERIRKQTYFGGLYQKVIITT